MTELPDGNFKSIWISQIQLITLLLYLKEQSHHADLSFHWRIQNFLSWHKCMWRIWDNVSTTENFLYVYLCSMNCITMVKLKDYHRPAHNIGAQDGSNFRPRLRSGNEIRQHFLQSVSVKNRINLRCSVGSGPRTSCWRALRRKVFQ